MAYFESVLQEVYLGFIWFQLMQIHRWYRISGQYIYDYHACMDPLYLLPIYLKALN